MPDGYWWLPPVPQAQPPQTLWPGRTRNECLVDTWGVFLADADGNLIGLPNTGGPPLAQTVLVNRGQTRNL